MKILLVEDNPGDARLIRAYLQEAVHGDVDLVHTSRLAEATAWATRETFDVVLLDLSLPDSHGQDSFRRINACAADTAVVVLTGLDDEEMASELAQAGAQDYVVKSQIDGRTLVRSIRYAIERKKTEGALRLASRVFESTLEGIVVTDAAGRIVSVNRAFTRITGHAPADIADADLWRIAAERHDATFFSVLETALATAGTWQGEIWLRHRQGDAVPAWMSLSGIRRDNGVLTHYVAALTEISALKRSEERLQYLALHDALTGLPNRVLFHDRLEQMISRSRRIGAMFAVMFLDLDRFKLINDTLGHAAGDALLKEVAERLKGCLRESDTVARLAGDEFAVILADIQQARDAELVGHKILHALSAPLQLGDQEVFVTASIGVSVSPSEHGDPSKLLENADVAMYCAKDGGGNSVQPYRTDMNAAAFERLKLETSLRRALERDEFTLHYQPQIDPHCGEVVAVEALIRWRHPERGIVSPAEFIPILEETGLIVPVGEWVIETACRQFKQWLEAGIAPRQIAVNLSMRQFKQNQLVENIARILEQIALPAGYLELEVTESVVMDNVQATIETLTRLKKMGIKIAIDDFGTGSSSLSYLKLFPIDTLKIAHSFVVDVPGNREDAAIATAIIGLARSMNLDSVAEGVETAAQEMFLREKNCDRLQGYLFEEPLPADRVTAVLRARQGDRVECLGACESQ